MSYVNCFWQGTALGDLEQICLLSILRQNHKVRLFCYDPIKNIPAGIEIAEAQEIMPRAELLVHRATGSPALGANKFRYLIMEKGLGYWLDTDVILLKPLPPTDDYIFGWQDDQLICNAILYLPQKSQLLSELCDFVSQEYPIPPFYDEAARSELEQKAKSGHPVDVRDMRWGVYGPMALTFFVWKNGLLPSAKSREIFYPVHWEQAHALLSSRYDVSDLITPSTIAVHLWNQVLRYPPTTIETGSYLEKFAREELGYRLPNSSSYHSDSRNAQCPCGSGKRFKHCHGLVTTLSRLDQPRKYSADWRVIPK